MKEKQEFILIKDLKVPFKIKSFKTSKTIKLFFKNDILIITKPRLFPKYKLESIINQNKDYIYDKYSKIVSNNKYKLYWFEKDYINILGSKYLISIINDNKTYININKEENKLEIHLKDNILNFNIDNNAEKEKLRIILDKKLIELFKIKTKEILDEKLPSFALKMNLHYKEVIIRDAKTKYGSCKPKTKQLYFSARLIMLPPDVIDAIIVHELAHLKYANHSKEFYDYINDYILNYKQIDKWLRKNPDYILF